MVTLLLALPSMWTVDAASKGPGVADHVSKTIATYDRFAQDWVAVANNAEIEDWITDSIKRFAGWLPGLDVLVPGCGDGRDSVCLSQQGKTVHSFDLSAAMLQIARSRVDAGSLWQMDLRELGSLQQCYAGIFASGCLYHLMPEEFIQFVADAADRLTEQGVFYLNMKLGQGMEMRHTPKPNYPGGATAQRLLQGDRFYAYYNEAQLEEILLGRFNLQMKRMLAPHPEPVVEYFLVRKD